VGDPEQIEPTVKVMRRIGYRKGMVFHGFNKERSAGMDELSTIGASRIVCFNDKGETEYMEINPEDAGLPEGNYEEIQPDSCRETEACRAVNLLAGRGGESRSNIVALNAGAIIWMSGKAGSLKEGVKAAGAVINQGKALNRLALWAETQNRRPDSGNEIIKNLFQKSGVL
jgi:anthranilate phosphoribosyltransferase